MKVSMSLDEELWWFFSVECKKRKTYASRVVTALLHRQLAEWVGEASYDGLSDARQLEMFVEAHAEETV